MFREHVDELGLNKLAGGDGRAESLAGLGEGEGFVIDGFEGAERAPGDAVAGLGEAREGTAEAVDIGEHLGAAYANVVEDKLAGDGEAEAHLSLDEVSLEAGAVGGHEEAADCAFVVLGPDEGDVGHVSVGDSTFSPR